MVAMVAMKTFDRRKKIARKDVEAYIPRLMRVPECAKYCPHMPTNKQVAALLLVDVPELFYGGAGGGGKTEFLLMDALQYVDMPSYRALILRADYPRLSLPGAIMDRAREWWIPLGVSWSETTKTFTFPSGAQIVFGYLASVNDKYRYGSSEFQFVAFDELTEFAREEDYTFLFSRLRRTRDGRASHLPLRMRAASNPTGPGREWVKRRFIDPPNDPARKVYLPARLTDNPHLDAESYVRSLSHLDPITRARILEGDWNVLEGGKFVRLEWVRYCSLPDASTIEASVRAWDLAATEEGNKTVGVLMGRLLDGRYVILDVVMGKWPPGQRDAIVAATAERDGAAVPIVIEQEPGSGGIAQVQYLARILSGYRVKGVSASGDKLTRAAPFVSQMEAGNVSICRAPWTDEFVADLLAIDPSIPARQQDFGALDASSLAFSQVARRGPSILASVSASEIGTRRESGPYEPESVVSKRHAGRTSPDSLADRIRRRGPLENMP
jgi:predicted phage terminase large subunit-like protein